MQIKQAFLLLTLSFSVHAIYAAKATNLPSKKNTPKDVEAFRARITDCNHWAGEEAYDKERGEQINQAVKKLRCHQLNSDKKALRQKYKNQTPILKILEETQIIF